MAAIEERKNKKGEVVSYRFRVSLGYDVHGKQVTKQKTWKPLPNMTKTQIKKELNKQAQQRIAEALGLDYKKVFKDVKRKQVSAVTVKRYNAMISGIFRHAVIQNIIPVNPCTRIRTPKSVKKEASYLDENEALRLFSELETAPEPYRTATRLCMFLGLRRGELCGLSWDDVDFERSLISVRRNVLYNSDDGLYEDTPKTYISIRDIKVSDSIMDMLKEYKKGQEAYSEELGDKWEESNKIFTNSMGGWLRPDSFSKWFSKFCKEKGFENTHAHTLRHTSATLMIMNGVPLRVVSQRLGHNSTTVTNDIYTHVIQRADEMAATALDKVLFSQNNSSESIA